MKTKIVKIVKIESFHVSNEAGNIVEITFEQSSFDTISGAGKYSFIELYTPLATLEAKTFKKLNQDVEIWMQENNNYDIHALLIN